MVDICRMRGAPHNPVVISGPYQYEVSRAWSVSERFATLMVRPHLGDDGASPGRQKQLEILRALSTWEALSAPQLFAGRIDGLSPRARHLILADRCTAEILESAFKSDAQGIWSPPGGWEDVVLLRGDTIVAWASTHDRIAVVPREFASERNSVSHDYATVAFDMAPIELSPELRTPGPGATALGRTRR